MRTHRSDSTRKTKKRPQKSNFLVVKFKKYNTPKKIWKNSSIWWKIGEILAIIILIMLGTMYGIARWYIAEQDGQPLTLGTTFIPDYASYLGLDPDKTLSAIINDLGVRQFRFTSYWTDIEPSPGVYNFTQLDEEFQQADASNSKVMLAIGLRQPRWPECHIPTWASGEPESVWYPQLTTFMTTVINRYKDNPALQSYQLENEYFLKFFGQCTNFSRSRLVNEFNLVKKLDPNHPVIIARSNNALGTPIGQPTPDEFGVSVYKRVWDSEITHRYLEYPFPAWFYAFLAGTEQIVDHRNTIIHELQAEAWMPSGEQFTVNNIPEQNKSMNATILARRFKYGEATGIKTIYLWGAEYWYWRMEKAGDPSLWNVARTAYAEARASNAQLELNKARAANKPEVSSLLFQTPQIDDSAS
jgi:hypothetical protein